MSRLALALLSVALLGACGKYDDKLEGPEPIPGKNADWLEGGFKNGAGSDDKDDFHVMVSGQSIGHEDVSGNSEYVYVWVLRKFSKDQQPEDKNEDKFNREYVRFALNCGESTLAGIAVERHYRKKQDYTKVENEDDTDDEPTSRKDTAGFQWEFKPAIPGTYQFAFMRQVCDLAAKKASEEKPPKKKKT